MVSKHRETTLCLVSETKLKSTRQILRELEKKTNKVMNWSNVYKILSDLERDGIIKRNMTEGGIFWSRVDVK